MLICVIRAHVTYIMNKKINYMCDNPCHIKCVFKHFSFYKWVVKCCPKMKP